MDIHYSPISCDFHDVLEASATRRSIAWLVFLDPHGHVQERNARIVDLQTRQDGEYMLLDSSECIRLDRIVSIDGKRLADYAR